MERAYCSIKELSTHMGVPEQTLYTWVRAKKIPCTRLNGVIRFHIATINQWLEKRTIQPKKVIA